MLEDVKLSPKYVLSFNENLNKKLQNGQIDILVGYWDYEKTVAKTRYLNSEFMVGANANQIQGSFIEGSFIEGSEKLNQNHMLHISTDGTNVNLKFLELYAQKRELDELPCLVDLRTCGLHTVHGSLENGIKCSGVEGAKMSMQLYRPRTYLQERIQWIIDITDTCFTDFFSRRRSAY